MSIKMPVLRTEINELNNSWKDIINDWIDGEGKTHWDRIEKEYSNDIEKYRGHLQILPYLKHIFSCFKHLGPENIKVVILGQDPYHGLNQAIGKCFAVQNNIITPPSLRNIEKELKSDIGSSLKDKTLLNWETQGVFLLNASLTVVQGTPGSHMKLWKPFTEYIIKYLVENYTNIIFVAWGSFAYDKFSKLDMVNHKLIVSSHPSPLSCNRKFKEHHSFMGSKPFSTINSLLSELNLDTINW